MTTNIWYVRLVDFVLQMTVWLVVLRVTDTNWPDAATGWHMVAGSTAMLGMSIVSALWWRYAAVAAARNAMRAVAELNRIYKEKQDASKKDT